MLTLFIHLLEQGFNGEEADNGGVCIESSMVMDYNGEEIEGDRNLIGTIEGHRIQYFTLSHIKLNQVLKDIQAGWRIPPEELEANEVLKDVCEDGVVSMSRLKEHDETFYEYSTNGLMWHVLAESVERGFR